MSFTSDSELLDKIEIDSVNAAIFRHELIFNHFCIVFTIHVYTSLFIKLKWMEQMTHPYLSKGRVKKKQRI